MATKRKVKKSINNTKKCGLCGSSTKPLTKTPCCDNWICDDSADYVLFSYEKNSCYRNHSRYTLCAFHFNEKHHGKWQTCETCKNIFDDPNYVDLGTNEFNFNVLENPKKIEIQCVHCGRVVNSLDKISYQTNKGYFCNKPDCEEAVFQELSMRK
jgi:hypothetical protein